MYDVSMYLQVIMIARRSFKITPKFILMPYRGYLSYNNHTSITNIIILM